MNVRPVFKNALARLLIVSFLPGALLAGGSITSSATTSGESNGCLGGAVKHLVNIVFDNMHFTRDNPDVPSDLEQMPNLQRFIQAKGALLTNHHTPLISHTANDILTSLTGVYPDRHGVPVANSFRYFNPNGTSNLGVSFAYWTDPIFDPTTATPTDTTFNLLSEKGTNAPAPWVPFARAGCDFGAVATANTVLENIATDIPTVFGANSPQAQEVATNPGQAFADFVGIGVHCAIGSALCSAANGGQPDRLPQEPGGYSGYSALFGHKYVAPQISPGGPLTDLGGNVIRDSKGNVGFPGFDGMSASASLAYVAAMQEHGIPVTYAYISDVHDNHDGAGAYGPGEAGYVAALKAYDDAIGTFFVRLAADGIDQSNTLFVFTSDEGDHFSGGVPAPAGCDGVATPCSYSHVDCPATNPPSCPANNVGETNANLAGLLATQQGITTPFKVHADSAPTVYITGNPARTDGVTRDFERAAARLTGINPITGSAEPIMRAMADPVEMKFLHMITADPARTPTFTYFADPSYFLFAGAPNCNTACVNQKAGFAWSHGDFQPDIVTTWLGLVGPGVLNLGISNDVWSDHTDIRPTTLTLTGLRDDYGHDGRVLIEALDPKVLPAAVKADPGIFIDLAKVYKRIDAPVGQLGLRTLARSTIALQGDDETYASIEDQLTSLTAQRDGIATRMIALLEGAAFRGQAIDQQQAEALIAQGNALLSD